MDMGLYQSIRHTAYHVLGYAALAASLLSEGCAAARIVASPVTVPKEHMVLLWNNPYYTTGLKAGLTLPLLVWGATGGVIGHIFYVSVEGIQNPSLLLYDSRGLDIVVNPIRAVLPKSSDSENTARAGIKSSTGSIEDKLQ